MSMSKMKEAAEDTFRHGSISHLKHFPSEILAEVIHRILREKFYIAPGLRRISYGLYKGAKMIVVSKTAEVAMGSGYNSGRNYSVRLTSDLVKKGVKYSLLLVSEGNEFSNNSVKIDVNKEVFEMAEVGRDYAISLTLSAEEEKSAVVESGVKSDARATDVDAEFFNKAIKGEQPFPGSFRPILNSVHSRSPYPAYDKETQAFFLTCDPNKK